MHVRAGPPRIDPVPTSWLRRFAVVWLLPALLLLVGCKHVQPTPKPEAPRQIPAIRAGHIEALIAHEQLDDARKDASAFLADEPTDPQALFISACFALGDGKLDEAQKLTDRLAAIVPTRTEPKILASLISARRTDPSPTSWLRQYAAAWTAAGYPDLPNDYVLGEPEPYGPVQFKPAPDVPEETRAIVALSVWTPDLDEYAWLAGYMDHADDEALLLAFADSTLGKGPTAEYRSVAARSLDRAVAAHPDNLALILSALDAEGFDPKHPTAFAPQDGPLLKLIASAEIAREKSFGEVVAHAEQALRAAHIPDPRQRAFQFGVRTLTPGLYALQSRATASYGGRLAVDEALLARALCHAGELIAAQSTLVERLTGSRAVELSAERLGELGKMHDAGETYDRTRAANGFFERAAPHRWPIPQLQDDLWRHKLTDEADSVFLFAPPEPPPDRRPR